MNVNVYVKITFELNDDNLCSVQDGLHEMRKNKNVSVVDIDWQNGMKNTYTLEDIINVSIVTVRYGNLRYGVNKTMLYYLLFNY